MKGAGSVRYVVLYEMPAIRPICSRSSKAHSQMVRRSADQVARSIDNRGQEKWVPRGFPLSRGGMCARLQGERYCCRIAVTTKQQIRVVGVSNVIDINEGDTSLSQAVVDGVKRQFIGCKGDGSLAVFDTGETLFLHRRNHSSILYQARCRVMIDRIDTQNIHVRSLETVNSKQPEKLNTTNKHVS